MLRLVSLDALFDTGKLDEALEAAEQLIEGIAPDATFELIQAQSTKTRILAVRGRGAYTAQMLDWLETNTLTVGDVDTVVSALGSAALARGDLAEVERVTTLLTQIEAFPGIRKCESYASYLPGMVRGAVSIECHRAGRRSRLLRVGPGEIVSYCQRLQPRRPRGEVAGQSGPTAQHTHAR